MNDQLRRDLRDHSDILWIESPLSETEIAQFSASHDVPLDLLGFWREFGSGLMFESEEILRPFDEILPIELVTEQQVSKGFPPHLTVFHIGIFVSGFDALGFEAFERDSFKFIGRFFSLDDWYRETIRSEFAARYGFPGS